MDTRTGYILTEEQLKFFKSIPVLQRNDPFNRTPEQFEADLVPVNKAQGEDTCPKCHGTGAVPRGLSSKRFKPCSCVQ